MIKQSLLIFLFVGCFSSITQAQQTVDSSIQDSIYTKVDEEAKFPGGLMGWKNFLERNLRAEAPILDGAKPGLYPVVVTFVVDNKGLVSGVKEVSSPKDCPSCLQEAIRVMRRGPKWIPAKLEGKPVKYQAVQKITFML